MIARCITLQQVKLEAVRRVKEDSIPRNIYVRKDTNRLVIRTWMDIIAEDEAMLICYACSDGQVFNF